MNKQWQVVERLDQDLWQHLLKSRGIDTPKEFFNPDLSQLVSPADWPDMDKAVARIQQAITNKEPVVVWGDFDADGVTSTAIVWETLHLLGANVLPYIPNRDAEGHGFSAEGLEKLTADGCKLIITVDHGITAFDDIKKIAELGMEVIITDHHQPALLAEETRKPGTQETKGSEYVFPECVAVIHPFRLAKPEKLAGCGAAYFLAYGCWLSSRGIQASRDPGNQENSTEILNQVQDDKAPQTLLAQDDSIEAREEFADTYIELAALGTIADMMPLTGMNRVLASIGLQKLATTKRIGLQELYALANLTPKNSLSIYEVGFVVAPRLNAPGRLAEALDSLRLVCTKDKARAKQLAVELDGLNSQRQALLAKVAEQAAKELEKHVDRQAYVLVNKNWPAGVCGLAAGKLVEKVYRPVVVMEEMGDTSRGSARSIKGFDITAALTIISDLLDGFGGHAMAAGFTCKTENILEIEQRLSQLVVEQMTEEQLQPRLTIDAEVGLDEMSEQFMMQLLSLEPCGMGNPKPVFVAKDVEVSSTRTMGKDGSHLRMTFEASGLEAVAFGFGARAPKIGDKVDVAFNLEVNEWNGKRSLQLNVKDMKAD